MKGIKIFFACAFGAFIGALVALQLSSSFWWLGAIAGFIVGYLSYQYRKVVQAVKTAWKEVVNVKKWAPKGPLINPRYLRDAAVDSLGMSSIITTVLISLGFFFDLIPNPSTHALVPLLASVRGLVMLLLLIMAVFLGFFFIFFFLFSPLTISPNGLKQDEFRHSLKLLRYGNPFAVWFYWIPYWITRFLVELSKVGYQLGKKTFFLIHSDIRLLCGIDAAIDAAIGYFMGNAFIGALAGGVLGVANYYLVSLKFLKLTPTK